MQRWTTLTIRSMNCSKGKPRRRMNETRTRGGGKWHKEGNKVKGVTLLVGKDHKDM